MVAAAPERLPAAVRAAELTVLIDRERRASDPPAARPATRPAPERAERRATVRQRTVRKPAAATKPRVQQPRRTERRPAATVKSSPDRSWRTEKKSPARATPRKARKERARQAAPKASGSVVAFAYAQIGDPYQFSASGPDAWDCSGLVGAAWRQAGRNLPRTTGGMSGVGRPVSRQNLKPGDLVFPKPGHVTLYVGNGYVIHAPRPGMSVEKTKLWNFSYARRP